jgi:hypothetical protein
LDFNLDFDTVVVAVFVDIIRIPSVDSFISERYLHLAIVINAVSVLVKDR